MTTTFEELDETAVPRQTLVMRVAVAVLVALAVIGATCCFVVGQNERVIVLRFGAVKRVIESPGLYVRAPWPINELKRIDGRLQVSEIRISEALTEDKRNIILPVYFAWKVEDPLKFVQAVGDAASAVAKLDAVVTSYRNSVLGTYKFEELVSESINKKGLAGFEADVCALVDRNAREHFGISIVQVGVKQLSLPEANIASVFRRMRAERKQFAEAFRAEGKREAEMLRAETEAEKALLIASAKRYAEETRGLAEAGAARIYADAHGQDMEFYRYLRELQTLRAVVDKNTTLILDTGMTPFHLLDPEHVRGQEYGPQHTPRKQALADAREQPLPLERTSDRAQP